MATPDPSTKTIQIYPYPLTNLQVTSTGTVSAVQDMSTYYQVTASTPGSVTISCDEYVDKTCTLYNGGSLDVFLGNLYAWTDSAKEATFYTLTTTPEVGDVLYDNNGEALIYGAYPQIVAVSADTISVDQALE